MIDDCKANLALTIISGYINKANKLSKTKKYRFIKKEKLTFDLHLLENKLNLIGIEYVAKALYYYINPNDEYDIAYNFDNDESIEIKPYTLCIKFNNTYYYMYIGTLSDSVKTNYHKDIYIKDARDLIMKVLNIRGGLYGKRKD